MYSLTFRTFTPSTILLICLFNSQVSSHYNWAAVVVVVVKVEGKLSQYWDEISLEIRI